MAMKLPKKYLSYSQLSLWLDNKDKYRARYYQGLEERPSKELLFGSEMAKGLEAGTIKLPDLIQYRVSEEQIKINIEGIPFFAYIDTFDPENLAFREYKTSKNRPDGSPGWTQKRVNEHMQLDIYSLLIQEKYGRVTDLCHLDCICTRNKIKTMEFEGNVLQSESNEVEMTGDIITFPRIITQVERDRMRALIPSIAREIANDYEKFLNNDFYVPSASSLRAR